MKNNPRIQFVLGMLCLSLLIPPVCCRLPINFSSTLQSASGPFQIQYTQVTGGVEDDCDRAITACRDGGIAVAGYSRSWGKKETDFFIYKLNGAGTLQWRKTYGVLDGQSNTMAYSIIENRDGDLVIVGERRVFNLWDTINLTPSYRHNIWVLKIDSNGNEIWSKLYGGKDYDCANAVIQCLDGGYVVAGHTQSFGAHYTPAPHAKKDLWIFKLSKDGQMEWQQLYGTPGGSDGAKAVRQCQDGGFIVAGFTSSFGAGNYDGWILKLDDKGNQQWSRTAGGTKFDIFNSVVETTTGQFVAVGETTSMGAGKADFMAVCYDAHGNQLWLKTYGGPGFERGRDIAEGSDHNLLLTGYTDSSGAGNKDVWLVKITSHGDMLASQTMGDANCDEAFAITASADKTYFIAGNTSSWGVGGVDGWVVKLTDTN